MKYEKGFLITLLIILITFILVSGCAQQVRRSSSLLDYLDQDTNKSIEEPVIPAVSLPLRIGIAFVPESYNATVTSSNKNMDLWFDSEFTIVFSGKEKIDLMERIGSKLREYPFVKSIKIIPPNYMVSKGGFTHLEQTRNMFGVDVIVLISYDQVQFTSEDFWSISYWTIVGAYFVKGEKNDTNTMFDAAVYHIPSHKLLFQATGTSHIKARATPINLKESLRQDSLEGFNKAADSLVVNLRKRFDILKENR
jgi:rhombotail lipoprotein